MERTSTFMIWLSLGAFLVCSLLACSKSGRKRNTGQESAQVPPPNSVLDKVTLKMENVNGVYQVPVLVNGIQMSFIFDTGASVISISDTEAIFLWKQGKLTSEDIGGKVKFSDANGDISEGTRINLREVRLGTKVLYDVEASVVHNLNAPLLLGQSALSKFGKVSIDYQKSEIILE
jgi:aspartyl protease family protein